MRRLQELAVGRTVAGVPRPLGEITRVLEDAAYVGVGLGVIAFQKAQVQRQELKKSLRGAVDDALGTVDENLKHFEERLRAATDR